MSRYYDPEMGRWINADDVSYLGANGDFSSLNLYVYCGNNPIDRVDAGGNFWLSTAVAKIVIGLATQYIADVIENIAAGETGWDIFSFRSTGGEYIAAGVTSLLPGSGIGSAILSNVVSESIVNVEKYIKGEAIDIWNSVGNVILGSIIDVGFNKVTDLVNEKIASLEPQNYSTYAGQQYKKNPDLTMPEIRNKMGIVYKTSRVGQGTASFASSVARNLLLY